MVYRTKYKGIGCEFGIPKDENGTAIILCDGFPTVPYKKHLIEYFAARGFYVFHPRYRGTWESEGVFLDDSPSKTILTIVDLIKKDKKVTEQYLGQEFSLVKIKKIVVLGGSFGGSVALDVALNNGINKVISVSPVINFKNFGQNPGEEDLSNTRRFVGEVYGDGYRIGNKGWDDLNMGTLLRPKRILEKTSFRKPLLLIASINDPVVPFGSIKKFSRASKKQLIASTYKGHLSLGNLSENLLRFIAYWSIHEEVEFNKEFLIALLTKRIRKEFGHLLHGIILYGSIQYQSSLDEVSDIDIAIVTKEPFKMEVHALNAIFRDFPFKTQVKIFSLKDIFQFKQNPELMYLHTTGAIIMPVLGSATVVYGSNPFQEILLSKDVMRASVIHKIEQYISRIEKVAIDSSWSESIFSLWRKKILFILYDFGMVQGVLHPKGLNRRVIVAQVLPVFTPELRHRNTKLIRALSGASSEFSEDIDFVTQAVGLLQDLLLLLKNEPSRVTDDGSKEV